MFFCLALEPPSDKDKPDTREQHYTWCTCIIYITLVLFIHEINHCKACACQKH